MMANRQHLNDWTIIINLATHPRRNRKIYWLLVSVLAVFFLAAVAGLVMLNIRNFSKFQEFKSSNQSLSAGRAALASENLRLSREVENFRRQLKPAVDEINSILDRKSFSWVRFFSRLEEALPARSFLISLNPSSSSAAREFRVKVALNNREELTGLLKNLQLQGFGEVRILNESLQDNKFQVEMNFRDVEGK